MPDVRSQSHAFRIIDECAPMAHIVNMYPYLAGSAYCGGTWNTGQVRAIILSICACCMFVEEMWLFWLRKWDQIETKRSFNEKRKLKNNQLSAGMDWNGMTFMLRSPRSHHSTEKFREKMANSMRNKNATIKIAVERVTSKIIKWNYCEMA